MRKQISLLLVILLALWVGTAAADGALGTPQGRPYEQISLSSGSNVADVIDWLEDFNSRDMAGALIQATDLAAYCLDIDQALAANVIFPQTEEISGWLDTYTKQDRSNDPSPKTIAVSQYRLLTQVYAKANHYYTRLMDLMGQYDQLRLRIQSGDYDRAEMMEMKAQLDQVQQQAEQVRKEALGFILGTANGSQGPLADIVADAHDQMNALSGGRHARKICAIQGLGSYLTEQEAVQVAEQEGSSSDPTITIAAKTQIVFTVGAGEDKVSGMNVTMTSAKDASRTKTVTTAGNGRAVFEVGDFLPDEDREVVVYVTAAHQDQQYRRMNLGLMHLNGGEVYHLLPEAENGDPYVVGVLFEDLDMLWGNDGLVMDHEGEEHLEYGVRVEIEPNGHTGEFVMYYDNAPLPDGGMGPLTVIRHGFAPGSGVFTVQGRWLDHSEGNNGPHFLPNDETEGTNYTLHMALMDPSGLAEQLGGVEYKPSFTFKSTDWLDGLLFEQPDAKTLTDGLMGNFSLVVPAKVPIIGGVELTLPKPIMDTLHPASRKWKVIIGLDRSVTVSYNIPVYEPSKDEYGGKHLWAGKRMNAMDNARTKYGTKATSIANMLESGIEEVGMASTVKSYGAVDFNVIWSVGAIGQLSCKKGADHPYNITFGGTMGVCGTISGEFTAVFPPAPFVNINIGLTTRVQASLLLGGTISLDQHGRFQSIGMADKFGVTITAQIELTVSAGIGIKGFSQLRAGITGWAAVTFPLTKAGFTGDEDIKWQVGFQVYVQVEILFVFKWKGVFVQGIWPEEDKASGSLGEPLPGGLEIAGRDSLSYGRQSRMVQTQDSVYGFWVEGQGTHPKIMMRDLITGETDVLFDSAATGRQYPYLYDYDVGFAPVIGAYDEIDGGCATQIDLGFHAVASMGDWNGFAGGDESAWTEEHLPDGLADHMKQHPCGATYVIGHALKHQEWSWLKAFDDKVVIGISVMPYHGVPYPTEYSEKEYDWFHMNYAIGSRIFINAEGAGCLERAYLYIGAYRSNDSFMNRGITWHIDRQVYPLDQITLPHVSLVDVDPENADYTNAAYGEILIPYRDGRKELRHAMVGSRWNIEPVVYSSSIRWGVPETIEEEIVLRSASGRLSGATVINMAQTTVDAQGAKLKEFRRYMVDYTSGAPRTREMDLPQNTQSYHVLNFRDACGDARQYLWWNESYAGKDNTGQDVSLYSVKAVMVDPELGCFSPKFTLMDGLTEAYDGLFYSYRDETFVLIRWNEENQDYDVRLVHTKVVPTLLSFITEYPTIAQGETFNLYFRLRNDSPVILEQVNIDVTAVAVGEGDATRPDEVTFESYGIDLREPDKSSVTHYGYMIEDLLADGVSLRRAAAMSREELTLAATGAGNSANHAYTEIGAHTITRITDTEEQNNRGYVFTLTCDEQGEITGVSAEEVPYFLPGRVATFQAPAMPNNARLMEHWIGDYTLTAQITGMTFTLSPAEGAQRYHAVLNDQANGADTFIFYNVTDEGDVQVNLFDAVPEGRYFRYAGKEQDRRFTDRQDAQEKLSGHKAFALAEQNDYAICTRQFYYNGQWWVEVQLSNEALAAAKDITPRLIVQTQYADSEWRNTGWSRLLYGMDVSSGFNRCILLPMRELLPADQRYERVRIGVVSTESEDLSSFYDLNDYNNFRELRPQSDLVFTRQPQDAEAYEGDSVSFVCEAQSSGPIAYQWVVCYPDQTIRLLEGETEPVLMLSDLTMVSNGLTFWCVASDSSGCSTMSNAVKLTVLTDPAAQLVIVEQPTDCIAPDGGRARFSVKAAGGFEPFAYRWMMHQPGGWIAINGADSDTLELEHVTMADTGSRYCCMVTDRLGHSVMSTAAELTVRKIPVTGDDTPIELLLLLCAACMLMLLLLQKRRQS